MASLLKTLLMKHIFHQKHKINIPFPLPLSLLSSLSSLYFLCYSQIGVATRSTVPSFSPELRTSGLFPHSRSLQQLVLTKIVNGERASYHAPKFLRLTNRSRAQLLLELTESLTEYAMATKQGRATRKINRRSNWLPVGATRWEEMWQSVILSTCVSFACMYMYMYLVFEGTQQFCLSRCPCRSSPN